LFGGRWLLRTFGNGNPAPGHYHRDDSRSRNEYSRSASEQASWITGVVLDVAGGAVMVR
jgi:hypothetical protein